MKRINKRIFFTLTLISSTFLPYLTINVKAKTDIPSAKIWTEDSGNISNGSKSFMFEDKKGNLWSAGTGTALQKYNYGTSRWETNNDIAGNISDGASGFMFQDSKHNLWSAGAGTPLQKYDYGTSRWETSPKISGNISDGASGFMFEDSKHNLWSAGAGTALQKYNYNTHTWDSSSPVRGNLKNGASGFMFEDSKHNLWSAGAGTALQKYDYGTSTWETNDKIAGNISNGASGFMFEDSKHNLWSARAGTPLQKYDYSAHTWKTSPAISGNISNSWNGFMFEDSKHNLWSAGYGTSLQKYDHIENKWKTSKEIAGNISHGFGGFMFEDSKHNLWSAGRGTALQKYDYGTSRWVSSPETSGNISDGDSGFMFEDSKHNLWSVGYGTALQVLYSDKDVASVIALIQANTGMAKITDAAILSVDTDSPFDVVALNSLGTGGTFPGDTKGTTLTYSHGGITSDGALDVTVKIAKGAATATATFTVSVVGINVAKKNKIQTNNLQALKTQLTGGNVINDADKVKVIATRIKDVLSLKTETGIDLFGLVNSSTYVISASGDKDTGVITISVIMTTNGATVPKSPPVTHTINHKSDATIDTEVQNSLNKVDVDNVKTIIEAITGVKKTSDIAISLVAANTPFNVAAFKALGGTDKIFPSITKGTTLTYSHGGITNDGNLEVTVTISKRRATAFASFTVVVHGINLAKVKKEANKFKNFNSTDSLNSVAALLPLNIENVKTHFEAITSYNAPNLTDGYSISKVIVKTALNTKTKKVVYTVTISDTNSNTATKDVVVTFAVKAIPKDKGLSKRSIAVITTGLSIFVIGIIGFLIYYYFKKIRK